MLRRSKSLPLSSTSAATPTTAAATDTLSSRGSSVARELDIKVVCVGAANTGKTTFLRYWETGECPLHLSTTIQMEFHRREMSIAVPPSAYFEPNSCTETTETTTTMASPPCDEGTAPKGDEACTVGALPVPFTESVAVEGNSSSGGGGGGGSRSSTGEFTFRRRRSPTPVGLSSNALAGSSSYAVLQNPFGDEYAITPPRLPAFYPAAMAGRSGSTRSSSRTTGGGEEGEIEWPLTHVPAIVKVWDIQGQESTKKMTRIFYTGAMAVIIFCEMSSNIESLTSALSWKSDVAQKIFVPQGGKPRRSSSSSGASKCQQQQQEKGDGEGDANPPCWLVVNKYDLLAGLPSPPSWASHAALDEVCARHGFAGWSYAAGRRGVNVEAVVRAVIAAAVERFPQQ
ncbi:putative ras-related protein rab, partial [Trypanosoma grayi]|uniref:putative ras-related protein rab n=1 Tax=Trypanosoma grayi TaxID=71804 RepID=UPI0004F440A1